MRKLLLVFTAAAFALGSCTKKQSTEVVYLEDTTHHHNDTSMVDTSLTISGISDIRTDVWGEQFINIMVNRNSGLERKVTMSISGVPENVEAEFSSVSGYTSFNTTLMLKTTFAKPGKYPLTITSTTDDGKTMEYSINLTIDTPTKKECNMLFLSATNNALSTTDPMKDTVVNTSTFIQMNTLENELYLSNVTLHHNDTLNKSFRTFIQGSNYHVMMQFDCLTGKISMPEQDVTGRTISGANTKTFKIYGEGKINSAEGTFEVTYITEHDDNGTIVINSYILKGSLTN